MNTNCVQMNGFHAQNNEKSSIEKNGGHEFSIEHFLKKNEQLVIENQRLFEENEILKAKLKKQEVINLTLLEKITTIERKRKRSVRSQRTFESRATGWFEKEKNNQTGKILKENQQAKSKTIKKGLESDIKQIKTEKKNDLKCRKIDSSSEKYFFNHLEIKDNQLLKERENKVLSFSPEQIISLFNEENKNNLNIPKKKSSSSHKIKREENDIFLNSMNKTTVIEKHVQNSTQNLQLNLNFKENSELLIFPSKNNQNDFLTMEKIENNMNKKMDKLITENIQKIDFSPEKTPIVDRIELDKSPRTNTLAIDSIGLNKFYEDFFIFGSDKTKVKKFSSEKELEISTLFSLYSPNNEDSVSIIKQLSKFVLPFSKKFRVVKIKNNFNKIKEIIFNDKTGMDFSFFSLNADSQPEMRLGTEADKIIKTNQNFEIFRGVNPSKSYFYYCLRTEDFFINNLNQNPSSSDLVEICFYPKAFIIKTIYPFSKLFFNVFKQIIQNLRKERFLMFSSFNTDQKIPISSLCSFDGEAFLAWEIEFFVRVLQHMDSFKITNNFEANFEIKVEEHFVIKYTLPSIKNIHCTECEIGLNFVLNFFTFEEFLFIIFSIFYEKSIIFVSESQFNISACISTFLALFRPFSWPFPVIYSLPEDCLLMLGSPIPIMVGLNLPSFHVVNDILPEFEAVSENNSNNNIYVFLDKGLFYYDFKKYDNLPLPQFDDFIETLEKTYKKNFNQKSSNWFKIKKEGKGKNMEYSLSSLNSNKMKESVLKLETVLIGKPSSKNNIDSNQEMDLFKKVEDLTIFHQFQEFLKKFISKKNLQESGILKKKGFGLSRSDLLQFSSNPSDLSFLEKFVKTQAFTYFLEKENLTFE